MHKDFRLCKIKQGVERGSLLTCDNEMYKRFIDYDKEY